MATEFCEELPQVLQSGTSEVNIVSESKPKGPQLSECILEFSEANPGGFITVLSEYGENLRAWTQHFNGHPQESQMRVKFDSYWARLSLESYNIGFDRRDPQQRQMDEEAYKGFYDLFTGKSPEDIQAMSEGFQDALKQNPRLLQD